MSYLPLATGAAGGTGVASGHSAGGSAEGSGAHGAESSRLGEGGAKHGCENDDCVGDVVVWWCGGVEAVMGATASPEAKPTAELVA